MIDGVALGSETNPYDKSEGFINDPQVVYPSINEPCSFRREGFVSLHLSAVHLTAEFLVYTVIDPRTGI